MMTHLSIYLLGSFQVSLDRVPVRSFESRKVGALLAYLAAESDHTHPRGKLAGLLWSERPEANARRGLSQALYNLRTAIGDRQSPTPFLIVSRETVQFDRSSDNSLDLDRFTKALAQCEDHAHPPLENCDACLQRLGEAVALYRGDFLADFSLGDNLAFEEWALVTRERARRQVMGALGSLTRLYQERGEIDQALSYAWQGVELDPLWEATHRRLIRLLALNGRRTAALTQYDVCRQTLLEELGVEPDRKTIALYERLRAEAQKPAQAPPLHNLPAPVSPFIGRDVELSEITKYLQGPDCRLLTLVGSGGSGKTRLALETVRALKDQIPQGVFFVALGSLASTESIISATAEALAFSIQEGRNPQEQLLNYLRERELLLLMDGYEHLLAGVTFLLEVLKAAPGVKILVTSRVKLNLEGEHLYHLEGMEIPPGDAINDPSQLGAVQLYLAGARRTLPHYEPSSDDLRQIVDICRQVGGMPLGILLGASWMGALTPHEILAQIRQGLDFLRTDWYDLPERQRSMRATFDYSWRLLSDREREVFQALSVFRDGFTYRAAARVCKASTMELRALVDKSFLQRSITGRYEVHELLRQYGAEKLNGSPAEGQAADQRHSAYFTKELQRWGAELKSPQQELILAKLDLEHENARTAWDWAVSQGRVDLFDRAVEGLCCFYDLRVRYAEGESACCSAAERLDSPSNSVSGLRIHARILIWASFFNRQLGRQDQARELLLKSESLLDQALADGMDTRHEQATLLLERGNAAYNRDLEAAQRHYRQSLKLYRELDDTWQMAVAMSTLAGSLTRSGDNDRALELFPECLALHRQVGDLRGLACTLRLCSFAHVRTGQLDQAFALMQDAVAIYHSIGDRANTADALSGLGVIFAWHGRFAEAIDLALQSLAYYQDLGNGYEVAFMNLVLGTVTALSGQYKDALEYTQTGHIMARENGFRRELAVSHPGKWVRSITTQTLRHCLFTTQPNLIAHSYLGMTSERPQPSYAETGQDDDFGPTKDRHGSLW